MKTTWKRKLLFITSLMLALCMTGTCGISFAAENETQDISEASKISSPRVTSSKPATWDCVWFGHYLQSSDGNGGFKEEPIKWRVLSVEGDEALLLADKNLDTQRYNAADAYVTWETSTIRSWLNAYGSDSNLAGKDYTDDNFLKTAFNSDEQAAIREENVHTPKNPESNVEGGNNTQDKVFLLSIDEVTNPDYGFIKDGNANSNTRRAVNTDYTKHQGGFTEEFTENGAWWLRSPGASGRYAVGISCEGLVYLPGAHVCYDSGYGSGAGDAYSVIRPALRLNLASTDVWSYAGTVSSDGTVDEIKEGTANAAESVKSAIPVQGVDFTTWDCVWLGRYPQSSDKNGGYSEEPIKWRVLSVNGSEALLLADKILDAEPYNETNVDVTWKTSTIRSWLNGYGSDSNQNAKDYTRDNFLQTAFISDEQAAIQEKTIKNPKNPYYDTESGDATQDKIFFLSIEEATTPAYGFSGDIYDNSSAKRAAVTPYAKWAGAYTATDKKYAGNGMWWLRSPGSRSAYTVDVWHDGSIYISGSSFVESSRQIADRPALYIDLDSDVWSYAGTVSSDGTMEEIPLKSEVSLDRITAAKTKTSYKTKESLSLNDLTVTAFYSDGTSKVITNYITNADEIDMTAAGEKTLSISYEENSVTKTATIELTVEEEKLPQTPPTDATDQNTESPQKPVTPATGPTKPTTATQDNKQETKPAKPAAKPKTVTLKKVSSTKKGTLKLTWKKDKTATGYHAVVATDKKFKKNKKSATIKKNKTVTKTFTKLKRKKTYFAKVRAYKQVGKTKVYGSYSKVKKAKVK